MITCAWRNMNNTSLNQWLPLIGVMIGGLLTGGFAWLNSWLQHRRQADENRKKLYREKLQDLYEVVSEFKNSYNRTTGAVAISLVGRQPFTDNAGPPIPVEKLQMLVRFYAPSLQPHLQKLLDSRDEFGMALVRRVGMERQSDAAIRTFMGEFRTVSTDLDNNAEEMQRAIVELSKNYI